MNDISCATETSCFAVGEGFADGGSPGARIYVTHDGGNTWTKAFTDTAQDASLMRVHAVSESEAWAAGGHVIGGIETYGTFYHSVDGGKSWALDTQARA